MMRLPIPARALARATSAAALLGAGALAACNDDPELVMPPATGAAADLMRSYVALGNSITAGYQSGGINDSTQRESYARLIANAAGTRYAYAALTMPGCPAPVNNFQTQARVGGGAATACAFRTQASATTALNNVAVPGAFVLDPISATTPTSNALTTFILGGKSQARRALDAQPTFVSVWLGNNDVLEAGVSGVLTPLAGVSGGITPQATFTAAYGGLLDTLGRGAPTLRGVLIGVVNVTNAPVLFPAAALVTSAAFRAGFEQFTGGALTIHPSCTATSRSLISFRLASAIRTFRTSPTAAGAHPPIIACEKGLVAVSPLVGEVGVLDGAEIDAITAAVTAYNTYIQGQANTRGFAYYDPNPALAVLRGNGIPVVPNLADAVNPFGTFISLDGVHPRRPAHVIVANGVIAAVNAKYGVTIPTVQ